MSLPGMEKDKLEISNQWDNDPCASQTAVKDPKNPLKYYRDIRDYRYREYAPWLPEAVGFDAIRGKKVLEIGVGMGSDHWSFASRGNEMTALDLSKEHLKQTKTHLELEGLKSDLNHGDAEAMPFAENSFDVVYAFGVLHHTPHPEKAFAEVHRVLKPGGKAIIALYHTHSAFFFISTLFVRGLIKGQLFYKSWRRFISEIEFRSPGSKAQPLVYTYTGAETKKLFSEFQKVDVSFHHIEPTHFSFFRALFPFLKNRNWLEKKFSRFGWYVVVHATK